MMFHVVSLVPTGKGYSKSSINFSGKSFQRLNVNLGECDSTNESAEGANTQADL